MLLVLELELIQVSLGFCMSKISIRLIIIIIMKLKLNLGGQIRTGQVVSDTRVEVFFAVHQLWNPYIMHLLQFDSNLKNMFS